MTETKSVKTLKKQLGAAIAMVCVAAVALGSSTYAWFINNTRVTAESVELTAETSYALMISKNATGTASTASDWVTLHTITNDTVNKMRPVSTNGADSLSDEGKLLFAASNAWDNGQKVVSYKEPKITDYWTESFDIKASQACKLFLSDQTTFNVDNNAAGDLDKVLRLALVVKKQGADAKDAKVFIYEVNNSATTLKAITTTGDANGIKEAIKCDYEPVAADTAIASANATVAAINAENYKSDAIATLADSKIISDGNSIVSGGNVTPIYTFNTPEEVCSVTAYIWMEGCDEDCVSANIKTLTEAANKLKVNLGFCAGN